MNQTNQPTIAIVAGEISGDILGAGLIQALKHHYPHARFIGVAGSQMQAVGCETLFDMEELSVMGLVEVIKHLPRLLKRRKQVINTMLSLNPDIFIGIDAPDFNLYIEKTLKKSGIKTVHYPSPSVWAWRQSRVYNIAQSVDLMLAFLPFEKTFYDRFNVSCKFVGHTMADSVALKPNRTEACQYLSLDENKRYLAVLVGSRNNEIKRLSEPFLQAAVQLKSQFPDIEIIVPLAKKEHIEQFQIIKKAIVPDLKIHLFYGKARQAMIIAEATLLASGTATLEAMLCKSPMVVGYKMTSLTYWLAKCLVKTPYIALPNLLANEMIVPELIQNQCVPSQLALRLAPYFANDEVSMADKNRLKQKFSELHQQIQCNADNLAAEAIVALISHQNGAI